VHDQSHHQIFLLGIAFGNEESNSDQRMIVDFPLTILSEKIIIFGKKHDEEK